MSKNISDGNYTIDAKLSGGSGKSRIASPTKLTVNDGKMTAEIEWSSSSYDYMKVAETEYFPENNDGHSVFSVDIPALDTDIPVLAETVAMSKPHMIEYTLYFDSSTIKSETDMSGIAAVCICTGVVLAAITAIFTGMRKAREKK